jgi:hypothetical protein
MLWPLLHLCIGRDTQPPMSQPCQFERIEVHSITEVIVFLFDGIRYFVPAFAL